MANNFTCAGCGTSQLAPSFDWQSVATGKFSRYCGGCDDRLIYDQPLPLRAAAAALGSIASERKAKASAANGKRGKGKTFASCVNWEWVHAHHPKTEGELSTDSEFLSRIIEEARRNGFRRHVTRAFALRVVNQNLY